MNEEIKDPFAVSLDYHLDHKYKKITIAKLANSVGVSKAYISMMRKGKRYGKEVIRRKIAEAYGMSYENFFNFGNSLIISQKQNDPSYEHLNLTVISNWQSEIQLPKNVTPINGNKGSPVSHADLVGYFIDPKKGKKFNEMLITLEHDDPTAYEQAYTYVLALYERTRAKKKENGNDV